VSETVAKHEQMLDDYSMRTWGELVPEQNRFREIVSGETIEARPEIKKVLRLIEQPKFKAVLIVDPQRLSRGDLEDIGYLSKIFRYTNTLIITPNGMFDISNDRDREYFERELMRGNDYLQYTKKILRNGIRSSVERGYYVGSKPPFGYRKVKVKDGKRTYTTLEIIPEEAEIVRMIFNMFMNGDGASHISTVLNQIGAIKPRYSETWRPASIYHILDNPHYIGKIAWNTRKTIISIVDGDVHKSRPRQDPELFDGKHPAIIAPELWEMARHRRKETSIPKVKSSFDIQNPLAGIMYCECGYSMRHYGKKDRSFRLYCSNQTICGNAGCTLEIIMKSVTSAIRSELDDIHFMMNDSSESEMQIARTKMLQSKLETLKSKRDSLWEKYAEGMPADTFERLSTKNEYEISECTALLSAAESEANSMDSMRVEEASLYAALAAIESDSAPIKETNELLKSVIKRITYRRKRAEKSTGGNRGGWISYPPEITVEFMLHSTHDSGTHESVP
jgi:DNA invertase Pin-like site-specific DNA recombinase